MIRPPPSATGTWSAYTALTGYFGGVVFQENTPLAVAVGIGLAFVVTGAVEGVRHVRRRRNAVTLETVTD